MSLNCNLTMVKMANFMLFMFYHNLKKEKKQGLWRQTWIWLPPLPLPSCVENLRASPEACISAPSRLHLISPFPWSLPYLILLYCTYCFKVPQAFSFLAQDRGTDKLVTSFIYVLGILCLPLWRAGSAHHEAFLILSILSCS